MCYSLSRKAEYYEVMCKAKDCGAKVPLGRYEGGAVGEPLLNPTKILCLACGAELEYTQNDVVRLEGLEAPPPGRWMQG